MRNNIVKFRTVKHADPDNKLQMVPMKKPTQIGKLAFSGLVFLVFIMTFAIIILAFK
jgi:hypothetical protein